MSKLKVLVENACAFNVHNNQGVLLYHIDAKVIFTEGIGLQAKIIVDPTIQGSSVFYKEFDGSTLLRHIVESWLYETTNIHSPSLENSDLHEIEIEVSDEDVITFFPNPIN